MEITKEVLLATKEQAIKERDLKVNEVNLITGRIQMIESLLAHLEKSPENVN